MNEASDYKNLLKEELAKRCERNPRYSVRAFAKALQIDVGALSRVLAGKQIPSMKLAQKILGGLSLAHEEQKRFVKSLASAQNSRNLSRLNPFLKGEAEKIAPSDLSIDHYRVIADWYHMGILELTFTKGFESNIKWIAQELGITEAEAKLAVERLLNLGLLEKQGGKFKKTSLQLSTTDKHLTTPALRKNQKQFLEKAVFSLENDPIEERNMTSMTMAIDPKKLPIARDMIREFNQTLCRFLESGLRTRVYNLGVALYPLQRKKKEK